MTLGVEKRVTSSLLETSSVEKIIEIDRHIGCATSGLQADARSMIEHARVESQNHQFHFNEPLRVESCTQAICDLALRFGEGAEGEESIMSRPFGVALLIAGFDEDGPQLYVQTAVFRFPQSSCIFWMIHCERNCTGPESVLRFGQHARLTMCTLLHGYRYHAEPSGTFYRYDAKAIGSGSEGAQAELQNEYHKVGRRSTTLAKPILLSCKLPYRQNHLLAALPLSRTPHLYNKEPS